MVQERDMLYCSVKLNKSSISVKKRKILHFWSLWSTYNITKNC